MIQTKAKQFHDALKTIRSFQALKVGWIGFCIRTFALSLCGEKQLADDKVAEENVEFILRLIKDEGLVLNQIYNTDEVGLI